MFERTLNLPTKSMVLIYVKKFLHIRIFHIRTEMPILAFSSLLRENKKIPVTKCYPQVGIEPRPLIASKSNTLLSTLT